MTVSILAELPEDLHTALMLYLETHADWDQDRLLTAALSIFLLQNGNCQRHERDRLVKHKAAQVYLNSLFKRSGTDGLTQITG
ncbi:MAG TPA: DUF2811 domain-containing protein [Coleofasciculaceae cyanobacterium]